MRPEKQFFHVLGIGVLIVVLGNVAGVSINASSVQFLPELCLFQRIWGIQCPGCGMTRAFLSLANFEWIQAWQYNPFSYFLMGLTIYYNGFIPGKMEGGILYTPEIPNTIF